MSNNDVVRGSASFINFVQAVLSPASVGANTTAEQTFTVTGLGVIDWVYAIKPSAQAGLSIANCRVSAANTLAITFGNCTGSPITPTASETYYVLVAGSLYNPRKTTT